MNKEYYLSCGLIEFRLKGPLTLWHRIRIMFHPHWHSYRVVQK